MVSEQTQGNSGWSLLLPKEHAALIIPKNAFLDSCSPELFCQARGLFPEMSRPASQVPGHLHCQAPKPRARAVGHANQLGSKEHGERASTWTVDPPTPSKGWTNFSWLCACISNFSPTQTDITVFHFSKNPLCIEKTCRRQDLEAVGY